MNLCGVEIYHIVLVQLGPGSVDGLHYPALSYENETNANKCILS